MDVLALRYYWKHFAFEKKSGLKLLVKKDIANSDTVFGVQLASPKYQSWANFLNGFFDSNKDANGRLLADAMVGLKEKAS